MENRDKIKQCECVKILVIINMYIVKNYKKIFIFFYQIVDDFPFNIKAL